MCATVNSKITNPSIAKHNSHFEQPWAHKTYPHHTKKKNKYLNHTHIIMQYIPFNNVDGCRLYIFLLIGITSFLFLINRDKNRKEIGIATTRTILESSEVFKNLT